MKINNDNKFEIIMKTAKELANDYTKGGWTGDSNEFTFASSSFSENLTNKDIEILCDEFMNKHLYTEGIELYFYREGRSKMIKIEKS